MAKIQYIRGGSEEAMADELHLIRNHLLTGNNDPKMLIMYAEQRSLFTLLTQGVTDSKYTAPGYINVKNEPKSTVSYNVPTIPKGDMISEYGVKYGIMGRIQKSTVILGQVGSATVATSTTASVFMLKMKTNELKPGHNVRFYNGSMARVQAFPTGTEGNYVYRFQANKANDSFDYTTWVAAQPGTKTCFYAYSTYGEKSLRGYANVFYPDKYINHTTTRRKGLDITGHANAEEVIWYQVGDVKGWTTEAEAQVRAQFWKEADYDYMYGTSTLKDSNGNLLDVPFKIDEQSGKPIWAGDGLVEQIRGANDYEASNADGTPTFSDFADMANAVQKKDAQTVYCVCGQDGFNYAQEVIHTHEAQLYDVTKNLGANEGLQEAQGYQIQSAYVNGTRILFVKNPVQDDDQLFPRRLANGKLAESMTYYFLDMTPDKTGVPNMQIKARGRNGVNRAFVYDIFRGMVGESGHADSPIDAKEIEMLSEDVFMVYKSAGCGIIAPSATA